MGDLKKLREHTQKLIREQEDLIARREISDDFYYTGRRVTDLTRLADLRVELQKIEEELENE